MTSQEELDQLLKTEGPILKVANAIMIGLGAAVKVYTTLGGNFDNLVRAIQLKAIIDTGKFMETEDFPGPDGIYRKMAPGLVERLVKFAITKYVPRV